MRKATQFALNPFALLMNKAGEDFNPYAGGDSADEWDNSVEDMGMFDTDKDGNLDVESGQKTDKVEMDDETEELEISAEEDDGEEEEETEETEEEESEESDEEETEEEEESEDDDEEESEEESDEESEEEGEEDDGEPDDKLGEKSKQTKQSDAANSAFAEMRRRAKTSEDNLNRVIKALSTAKDTGAVQQKENEIRGEINSLNQQYIAAVSDEDVAKAGEILSKISDKQIELAQNRTQSSAAISQAESQYEQASAEVRNHLNAAQATLEEQYPELHNKTGDPTKIRIVNSFFNQKINAGVSPVEALVQSVEEYAQITGAKSKEELEAEAAKNTSKESKKKTVTKRTKTSVKKRIKAATNKANRNKRSGKSKSNAQLQELSKMTDKEFDSKENEAALQAAFGIKYEE